MNFRLGFWLQRYPALRKAPYVLAEASHRQGPVCLLSIKQPANIHPNNRAVESDCVRALAAKLKRQTGRLLVARARITKRTQCAPGDRQGVEGESPSQ